MQKADDAVVGVVMMGGAHISPTMGVVLETSDVSDTCEMPARKHDNSVVFRKHFLGSDDTITALALRYGSTPEGIMRANGMITNDLDLLPLGCCLRIPVTHEKPLLWSDQHLDGSSLRHELDKQHAYRRRMVREFAERYNCSTSEAGFYLEDAQFDMKAAAQALSDDLAWEASAEGKKAKALLQQSQKR